MRARTARLKSRSAVGQVRINSTFDPSSAFRKCTSLPAAIGVCPGDPVPPSPPMMVFVGLVGEPLRVRPGWGDGLDRTGDEPAGSSV